MIPMTRTIVLLALLVATTAPARAGAPDAPADPAPAERTDCLQTRSIMSTQASRDGYWYARTRDGKWWKNSMQCPGLLPRRALVHTSPIGSQCRGDIVQVVDFTMGGVNFGGCGLGHWERVAGPPGKPAKPAEKPGR